MLFNSIQAQIAFIYLLFYLYAVLIINIFEGEGRALFMSHHLFCCCIACHFSLAVCWPVLCRTSIA